MIAVCDIISQAESQSWQVNGLELAGLSWGQPGDKPLLALHGWMDNAASFALLAPLLAGYHVVALDLTGQGMSARRSADASYQIWDDLPEILGVLEQLGWERFTLLGHSRGAIISALLSSACPERVESLVLLDAVFPMAVPEEEFSLQMRKALDDKAALSHRANRIFSTLEQAAAGREAKGLTQEAARLLVQRNLRKCDGGLTWTTDPRLHGASAVKLTQGQVTAFLQALNMPTLLMVAADDPRGISQAVPFAQSNIPHLVVKEVRGGHHFHMESGVADVARNILKFLDEANG